jgi:hypothetical protein
MRPMDIATMLTVITNLVVMILILLQLREQNRQGRFDAMTKIHDEVGRATFRKALFDVFNASRDSLRSPPPGKLRESIELVLSLYDLLGAKIKSKVVDRDLALSTEWTIIVPLSKQLQEFIAFEAKRRNTPYKEHFNTLAQQARDFQREHYPHNEPKIVPWVSPSASGAGNVPAQTSDDDSGLGRTGVTS